MILRRIPEFLALLAGNLLSSERSQRLHSSVEHLRWLEDSALPSAYLGELFPGIAEQSVCLTPDVAHGFELPYGERMVLAAIANHLSPQRIFEFGTFTGTTTRLLADTCPEAQVETIDLPHGTEWDPWIAEVVGTAFRDRGLNIHQHRADSLTFDFESRTEAYDLVFIDASHDHADVLSDSANALRIIRPDGIIVWDDYHAGVTGVISALNQLQREGLQIVRIAASRLAVHRPSGLSVPPDGRPWEISPGRPRPTAERYLT